jgi:hypothetical protein
MKDFVETNLNSTSFTDPVKFVSAHSLLCVIDVSKNCYWYARGGVRATDDGTASGTFVGDQATLQATMVAAATRAQAFVYGHDHFTVAAEKLTSGLGTGVHFIVAAKPHGNPVGWGSNRAELRGHYDSHNNPTRSETLDIDIACSATCDDAPTNSNDDLWLTVTRSDGTSWSDAGWANDDFFCLEGLSDASSNRCCRIETIGNAVEGCGGSNDCFTIYTDNELTSGAEEENHCDTMIAATSDESATVLEPTPDYDRGDHATTPGTMGPGFFEIFCDASECHFDWIQTDTDDASVNNTRLFRYTVPVGG